LCVVAGSLREHKTLTCVSKESNALGVGHFVFKKQSVFFPCVTLQVPSGYHGILKKTKMVFTPSKGLGGRFVGNWVQAQLQPPPCGALIPIKPTPLALPYTKVFAS